PLTALPSFSITPTGSWPTVSPGATGYSPLRICTSVPQMVVVVMRIRASLGPTSGMGLSASSIRPGSTNTAALIISAMEHLLTGNREQPAAEKQNPLHCTPRPQRGADQDQYRTTDQGRPSPPVRVPATWRRPPSATCCLHRRS